MSDSARLADLRTRLLDVLADITRDAHVTARERCPYRAADDRCTLGRGCRNQLRLSAGITCNGARLTSPTGAWP